MGSICESYTHAFPSEPKATSTLKGDCQRESELPLASCANARCCIMRNLTIASSALRHSTPGAMPFCRAICSTLRNVPVVAKPRSLCSVSRRSATCKQMQQPSAGMVSPLRRPSRPALQASYRSALSHGGRGRGRAERHAGSGAKLSSHIARLDSSRVVAVE